MTNKPLVALGVVLAVAGLGLMIGVWSQSAGPPSELGPGAGVAGDDPGMFPSYAWSIVAGITLAVGAACIMLGMNRWKQGAR